MLNHGLRSSKSDTWETPRALFAALDAEFGFTLDACALPGNAKCARYYTPEDDGLAQPWEDRVFLGFSPSNGSIILCRCDCHDPIRGHARVAAGTSRLLRSISIRDRHALADFILDAGSAKGQRIEEVTGGDRAWILLESVPVSSANGSIRQRSSSTRGIRKSETAFVPSVEDAIERERRYASENAEPTRRKDCESRRKKNDTAFPIKDGNGNAYDPGSTITGVRSEPGAGHSAGPSLIGRGVKQPGVILAPTAVGSDPVSPRTISSRSATHQVPGRSPETWFLPVLRAITRNSIAIRTDGAPTCNVCTPSERILIACPECSDCIEVCYPAVAYCNPPYGRKLIHWIRKAAESARAGATVVCLVPARTDTSWWQDWVMPHAEVRFLRGRLYFGPGEDLRAPFPSAVAIFRPPLIPDPNCIP